MTVPWKSMQEKMDAAVDATFGETIDIYPRKPGGVSDDTVLDPDRPIVQGIRAVKVNAGVQVEGTAQGFTSRELTDDVWVSIEESQLAGVTYGKPDRVYFVDRDEWFEIVFVRPSATYRPDFHLVPVKDNSI